MNAPPPMRTYDAIRSEFRWRIPERFNIGTATIGRHADRRPGATALIEEDESGSIRTWTFWELRRLANKLSNVLVALGCSRATVSRSCFRRATRRASRTLLPTGQA